MPETDGVRGIPVDGTISHNGEPAPRSGAHPNRPFSGKGHGVSAYDQKLPEIATSHLRNEPEMLFIPEEFCLGASQCGELSGAA